jgi:hypothetical protein
MAIDTTATVTRLCGATLKAVTIVMDYVQCQRGGAQLTTDTLPVGETADRCR